MERVETLAMLARLAMLTPQQAVALPAVVERAATSMNMTEAAMIETLKSNPAALQYIASVCRQVTSQPL